MKFKHALEEGLGLGGSGSSALHLGHTHTVLLGSSLEDLLRHRRAAGLLLRLAGAEFAVALILEGKV